MKMNQENSQNMGAVVRCYFFGFDLVGIWGSSGYSVKENFVLKPRTHSALHLQWTRGAGSFVVKYTLQFPWPTLPTYFVLL